MTAWTYGLLSISTFFVSGLRRAKRGSEEEDKDPDWGQIIASLSLLLKKLPSVVSKTMTLFQAAEIRKADHRRKQFEASLHGAKLPDWDAPRTEDGRVISSLDDVLGLAGGRW